MATVKLIEYEGTGPEVREVYDDIMATRQIDLLSCGQQLLANKAIKLTGIALSAQFIVAVKISYISNIAQ